MVDPRNEPATLRLSPGAAPLSQLRRVLGGPVRLELSSQDRDRVEAAHRTVQNIVQRDKAAYGINTGFGLLANTRIETDRLSELQRNLVLSHSTGTGALLDDDVVRLVLVLKVLSLLQGHSGVSMVVIEAMLRLLEMELYPCVPSKGSVGASGDLAPLAHLVATLLGEGQFRHHGEIVSAAVGLERGKIAPLELGPKEGLALLNGTQVSTALAVRGLIGAEKLLAAAVLAGALSVDAIQGSFVPFDPRIHELRRHEPQKRVAAAYHRLLQGSHINLSHVDCDRVQDPYSLRCQPQVMGACLDQLEHAARVLVDEANAVTDNPLIFPDTGDVLSGGNFHAEPVAMAADGLALAIAEMGSLSERRIALLVDPHMSGLPAFLVEDSGLNSGFMIAHVTAAALTAENKTLAHPSSVDSLPTSANQEDHVSMAAHAARRLGDMVDNAAGIVAIELLAAAQGIEFHRPHCSSDVLEEILAKLRRRVPRYERDRYFAPDIEAAKELVLGDELGPYVSELLPSRS